MCWRAIYWFLVGIAVVGAGRAAIGAMSVASALGPARFLVAEVGVKAHGDSYVLPLIDPDAIAHARRLIELGPAAGRKIVSAWIAPGANGINRDYLAPGAPAWSWHITGLREFTDSTAEIFDGWPTFVEADVPGWMHNAAGQVGFWDYSVVAELPVGDYDADLDVDVDDLAAWRAGFGRTVDLSADGNGNGVVDAADYILWRRNLGTKITLPSPSIGVVVGVPEPAAGWLACVSSAGLFFVRRRAAELPLRAWMGGGLNECIATEFVGAGAGLDRPGHGRCRIRDGIGRVD